MSLPSLLSLSDRDWCCRIRSEENGLQIEMRFLLNFSPCGGIMGWAHATEDLSANSRRVTYKWELLTWGSWRGNQLKFRIDGITSEVLAGPFHFEGRLVSDPSTGAPAVDGTVGGRPLWMTLWDANLAKLEARRGKRPEKRANTAFGARFQAYFLNASRDKRSLLHDFCVVPQDCGGGGDTVKQSGSHSAEQGGGNTAEQGGGGIPANRIILATQSAYFSAFFANHPDRESVTVPHPAGPVAACLQFLHTRQLELTADTVQSVLEFAHYVELTDVIELCTKFMAACLDTENALEVLSLADHLALAELRTACLSFICCRLEKLFRPRFPVDRVSHANVVSILSSDMVSIRHASGIVLTERRLEMEVLALVREYANQCRPPLSEEGLKEVLLCVRLPVWPDMFREVFGEDAAIPAGLADYPFRDGGTRRFFEVDVLCDPLGSASDVPPGPNARRRRISMLGHGHRFITKVGLSLRVWDGREIIGGLQLFWSDNTDDYVGEMEDPVYLELREHEHIVEVRGFSGWYLDTLSFLTNTGRLLCTVAGDGGEEFSTADECRTTRPPAKDNSILSFLTVDDTERLPYILGGQYLVGLTGEEVMSEDRQTPANIRFAFKKLFRT